MRWISPAAASISRGGAASTISAERSTERRRAGAVLGSGASAALGGADVAGTAESADGGAERCVVAPPWPAGARLAPVDGSGAVLEGACVVAVLILVRLRMEQWLASFAYE